MRRVQTVPVAQCSGNTSANKEKEWLQFDEYADTILEAIAKGNADQRFQNMTTIIISLAAERFGLEEKRAGNLPYTIEQQQGKQDPPA
ncbi:hypothetical protein SRHO_G00162130 [Serrasalmus rhombeus]